MLKNRCSDHYKGLCTFLLRALFCPQPEFPPACLCRIGDSYRNPPRWLLGRCCVFSALASCGAVLGDSICTVHTSHKREICLRIFLKVMKFCGGWLSPRQELSLIPRLYWFFQHLQSSDHGVFFLIKPS